MEGRAGVEADLLVRNVGELLTCAGPGPRRGREQGVVGAIAGGALAARAGQIVAVGREADVVAAVRLAPGATTIDAGQGLVAPGWVDAHTHPVFAGYREDEFNRILAGESYEDIARSGGGIRRTVAMTRAAGDEELEAGLHARLDQMLGHGTTTAETKSGYGLSRRDEVRALELLRAAALSHPLELVPTVLAAHTVPAEYAGRSAEYVDLVVGEILPAAAPLARFCDVFCDPTAFTPAETRRVLEAGRRLGLGLRLHADEFSASGGAELAAEMGVASADHLGGISPGGIEALARAGVMAVLLPGTLYFLGQQRYAPARRMIEAGIPIALGTDLNPGSSFTESMPAILQLACLMMRMTVEEALVAATLNAAWSLGVADRVGSLEPGKQADLAVYAVPNRFHLVYHYGVNHLRAVVKRGRLVWSGGQRAA